ncbi:hypothetical protein ACTFIV_004420 [Dictyostelium citrinum]
MSLSNLTNDDEPTPQPTFYCSRVVVAVVVLNNPASQVKAVFKLVSIHIITELSGTLNEKFSQYHQCHHPYPTSTPSNTRPNTSSTTTTTMKKQIKMLGIEQNRVLSGFDEDGIHKSILEAIISD